MAQVTIDQAMQTAMQHHQTGRLQQAEQLYRQILAQVPEHAPAMHCLGLIAHQVGRNDIAVDFIRRAIAINPNLAEAHSNLGHALRDQGQLDEAIAACHQAIALKPNFPEAHNNLGNALKDKGQLDDAIAACRQAIALKPDFPEAHINLGNALRAKGQLDEAVAAYRQAIALHPNFPEAHSNLGDVLRAKGQLDEAIAADRQAILLRPNYVEAHINLGNALRDKGQIDEAIAAYRWGIVLNPNLAEVHSNLGNALREKGELNEAILECRQAIALKPNYAEAYSNLGVALKDQGQLDEAIAAYRQAIASRTDLPEAHSDLLLMLHYRAVGDASVIVEEHRRWNRQYAEPLAHLIQPHMNDRCPGRRLRIGYVSPDFREHPVGEFILPLLENHDRMLFQVFAYAQVRISDAQTGRLRAQVDCWRDIARLSDVQVADLIRRDEIDILVDLAGHTADNRLLVFAQKPAPVQVAYLGYPNTTGLSAMDYRLTDESADPLGSADALQSEKLIRLPQTNWVYDPPEEAPIPDHHPAAGSIVFGCFNDLAKVTDAMFSLWGRILHAVPGSRLLLKSRALGIQSVRQRIRGRMAEEGIDPERLELRGHEPGRVAHLALYNRVDIALDPFPYHGTATTCEALWMGVPVITLCGQPHVSRVGVSLLTSVGLTDLIARSPGEYLDIAISLAGDLSRLRTLHSTLRDRMEKSPLMDAPRFARNVESAYREMWRRWCDKRE